jgi:RNA recognition motif-containing protein
MQESFMNNKLYVGNLSFETTEADLQTLFARAGNVQTVSIIRDKETGRARGFGFVEMTNETDAQNAIDQFNEQPFAGRNLTVNVARPQAARSGGYGGGRRSAASSW